MTAMARWSLIRAWAEHLPFDYESAARISGLQVSNIRQKAEQQGWVIRNGHRGRAGREELNRLRDRLWARLDATTDRATDEPLPKVEIDSIQILLRAVEKLETACDQPGLERGEPEAERLAAVLTRVNVRILEMARSFAADAKGATGQSEMPNAGRSQT